MYRCRHEQEEDPYASGNENRRQNRDRINQSIERYNLARRIRRGDYEPQVVSSIGYGSPMSTFCGSPQHHGYSGYPGIWRPGIYPPYHSDSDDEGSSSPWRYPPPPYYGSSPLSMQTPFGRQDNVCSRPRGRRYVDSDDEYLYGLVPYSSPRRRCARH